MKTSGLSRRSVLGSVGAGAALLPFIPRLEREASAAPLTKRIFFMYTANGTIREKWLPAMDAEGRLVLSDILRPLEPHKANLLVIDGLDYAVCEKTAVAGTPPIGGHYGGFGASLTGYPVGPRIDNGKGDAAPGSYRKLGITVDQQIANTISASTKLKSVNCGLAYASSYPISFRGPDQPVPAINDHNRIFTQLFGNFVPPGAAPAGENKDALIRASVIDFVKAELDAVKAKLGAADRQKMDGHLQSIRELETSLLRSTGAGATSFCKVPPNPPITAIRGAATTGTTVSDPLIPAVGRRHMELVRMAFACDLTRVAMLQYGMWGGYHGFPWLGAELAEGFKNNEGLTGFHGLAHDAANPTSRAKLVTANTWFAGEVAHFVSLLKEVPEGGGTMADNTLVVWFNEMGTGNNHKVTQTPWVLVGSAGGHFKTGRLVSTPGQPHNKLLVSLCQSMGLPDTKFGDPDFGNGGALAGLTA